MMRGCPMEMDLIKTHYPHFRVFNGFQDIWIWLSLCEYEDICFVFLLYLFVLFFMSLLHYYYIVSVKWGFERNGSIMEKLLQTI